MVYKNINRILDANSDANYKSYKMGLRRSSASYVICGSLLNLHNLDST